jgi:channel protein (hemolysin III family)
MLRCFDFVGICVMICGCITPPFYYGFMCDETRFYGRIYIAATWFFCLSAMFLTLYYRNDPTKKLLNSISYIVAGYSVTPGLIHAAFYLDDSLVRTFGIWHFSIGGAMYAGGAILFALHIPDRFFPNSRFFATYLQSHTIFHWCCLGAALLHFWGSLRCFHERQLFPCPELGLIPTTDAHFAGSLEL